MRSEGQNQGRRRRPKRRHSTSSHEEVLVGPDSIVRRSPVPPDAEPNYSPTPERASNDPFALRTHLPDHGNTGGKKYEKRPRHKTKADKYNLKTGSKPREPVGDGTGKQNPSKRRRRKSGVALNHEFKAPNVAQDRLTLKANGGPGIFQNAKASYSVERRGLPDLTFPDMNFLKTRRDPDDDQRTRSKAKKVSRREKDKAFTQQISQYFEPPTAVETAPRPVARRLLSAQSRPEISPPSSVQSCLSEQLGRESQQVLPEHRLRHSHAAAKNNREEQVGKKTWVSDIEQPEVEHCQPHSRSSSQPEQARSSTSYYSWSVTPSRTRSAKEVDKTADDIASRTQQRESHRQNGEPPHAEKKHRNVTFVEKASSEPIPESALSQPLLDEYIQRMLLESDKGLRKVKAQNAASTSYTLADLKHLARLGSPEITPKDTYAPPNKVECQHPVLGMPDSKPDNAGMDSRMLENGPTKTSSRVPHHASINNENLFMPQISSILTPIANGVCPSQRSHKAENLADSLYPKPSNSNPTEHDDLFASAKLRKAFAAEQARRNISSNQVEIPAKKYSSIPTIQPGLERHQWRDFQDQIIIEQPWRDSIQQIISDIEQEGRLLFGQNKDISGGATDDIIVANRPMEYVDPELDCPIPENSKSHPDYDAFDASLLDELDPYSAVEYGDAIGTGNGNEDVLYSAYGDEADQNYLSLSQCPAFEHSAHYGRGNFGNASTIDGARVAASTQLGQRVRHVRRLSSRTVFGSERNKQVVAGEGDGGEDGQEEQEEEEGGGEGEGGSHLEDFWRPYKVY